MIEEFNVKLKASSENDCQFIVEIVKNCMNDASIRPIIPPTAPRISDSVRKADKILFLRNPSARNVPISIMRLATEAYIVIIAPIIAPTEKNPDNATPK